MANRDAAALPFENSIFDVVLCQQGVQFFPDHAQALREMRRVLCRNGRLAFTVGSAIGDIPYLAALTDALLRHLGHLAALPVSPEIARLSPERRDALVEEVREALSAFVDGGRLSFPAGVNVVTADA